MVAVAAAAALPHSILPVIFLVQVFDGCLFSSPAHRRSFSLVVIDAVVVVAVLGVANTINP